MNETVRITSCLWRDRNQKPKNAPTAGREVEKTGAARFSRAVTKENYSELVIASGTPRIPRGVYGFCISHTWNYGCQIFRWFHHLAPGWPKETLRSTKATATATAAVTWEVWVKVSYAVGIPAKIVIKIFVKERADAIFVSWMVTCPPRPLK